MLGSEILEVAIGVVFLFCLLSLVATAVREWIEHRLQVRAVMLERGVRELLNDPNGSFVKQLYDHSLIGGLFRGDYDPKLLTDKKLRIFRNDSWKQFPQRSTLPSYIPSRNFALAMLDLANTAGSGPAALLSIAGLREGAAKIANARVRQALVVALDHAAGDIDNARANLEKWFDSGMDRVSGWYRKHTQFVLLWIGLVLAVAFNVDAFHVASELMKNDDVRKVIVAEAESFNTRNQQLLTTPQGQAAPALACTTGEEKGCAVQQIKALSFPIGWEQPKWGKWKGISYPIVSLTLSEVIARLLGWLLTAVAISLGAPFWFDTLNRIMVIRSTVKPHEKSPEEASEDRQSESGAKPGSTVVNVQTAPIGAGDIETADFEKRQWAEGETEEGDL